MSRKALEDCLHELAAGAVRRPWLVILPASGTVFRSHGALLYVNVGGETGWSPFIVDGTVALALDPRALVVDEESLQVAYHPRDHVHEVHKAAGEWYAQNPDVFRREAGSGKKRL